MTVGDTQLRFGGHYWLWFVGFALLIRCLMSGLRTAELHWPPTDDPPSDENGKAQPLPKALLKNPVCLWWLDFSSRSPSARVRDFFHPFLIGLFELSIYPPLLVLHEYQPIGGWLLLKTAAQWTEWKTSRPSFQRFLIGSAMVILAALKLATMITKIQPGMSP